MLRLVVGWVHLVLPRVSPTPRRKERRNKSRVMKSKYMHLKTGVVLSFKELLAYEKGEDRVWWEAADEMRSLLLEIAEAREEQAQHLLMEAQVIRECVKNYDAAEEQLDKRVGTNRRGC
jgi:uncharacterized protein YPO0396